MRHAGVNALNSWKVPSYRNRLGGFRLRLGCSWIRQTLYIQTAATAALFNLDVSSGALLLMVGGIFLARKGSSAEISVPRPDLLPALQRSIEEIGRRGIHPQPRLPHQKTMDLVGQDYLLEGRLLRP